MKNITRILGVAFMATGFVVGASQTALADIKWLPKFQDGVTRSRVNNANSKSMANPLSCEAKGWLSEKPANLTCQPKYLVGGIKCWSDCQCDPKYKYVAGKGVTNGCPNGQTVNNDSCGGKYSGCVDCSTNTTVSSGWGTTYKSGSNVAVMTNYGTCANYYYSCNSGYKPATTQSSSSYLQTGPWNWISCGTNEKAINQDGTSNTPKLCQKCQAKVCADYNSGYVTADDTTKACTKVNSDDVGGLNCWSCVACGDEYQYTTATCPSPKILGTDLCNGKASTCSCPATVTCGSGITCKTQAPSGCSGCIECNTCPNEGTYSSCPTGYTCTYEECSQKYYITGCATNYQYWCTIPETNCIKLNYTSSTSSCSGGYLVCPFDTSKVHCLNVNSNTTDCSSYSLASCPENGTCSFCEGKYRLDSCNAGYELSSNSCNPLPCISEEYVQQIAEAPRLVFRTPIDKPHFCNGLSLWEQPLCENRNVKIFECEEMATGGAAGETESGTPYISTNGAIAWIKSQYCGGGTKAQCLEKYSSLVLSSTAFSNLRYDVYGENFSVYISQTSGFTKYICDWCPRSLP